MPYMTQSDFNQWIVTQFQDFLADHRIDNIYSDNKQKLIEMFLEHTK